MAEITPGESWTPPNKIFMVSFRNNTGKTAFTMNLDTAGLLSLPDIANRSLSADNEILFQHFIYQGSPGDRIIVNDVSITISANLDIYVQAVGRATRSGTAPANPDGRDQEPGQPPATDTPADHDIPEVEAREEDPPTYDWLTMVNLTYHNFT